MDAGGRVYLGSGTSVISETATMLDGTFDNNIHPLPVKTTDEARDKYLAVIKANPAFPFAYAYLSAYQKEHNDPAWKDSARKAIDILKVTVTISECHADHKKVLDFLEREVQMAIEPDVPK
jgi:hypothetical protein